jgi:WhiB family redox-sensing transcriptional regulator
VDTDWLTQGKCRDMDSAIFFPSDGIGVQAAQRICAECPVKAQCLEYALADHVDHGVWGGTSERERRRILRHRRMSRLQPTHR